jgi:hypothetical protein
MTLDELIMENRYKSIITTTLTICLSFHTFPDPNVVKDLNKQQVHFFSSLNLHPSCSAISAGFKV